ncbi:MAG: hypothetical protein QHJ82_05235 [Verrucomicrobiota bacterium]|nr:hypothetical protein [Verrucomicrobiota bacterium]
MKRGYYIVGIGVLLVALLLWFSRQTRQATGVSSETTAATSVSATVTQSPQPAPLGQTNKFAIPQKLMEELNKFIAITQPYGLERPITKADVTYFTNAFKTDMTLETKTHLVTFFDYRVTHFLATYDMSNPVTDAEGQAEARRKWYQATARWSEQEALAETHRILASLGIHGEWTNQKAEPFTLTVKNPQGERVRVTPFYTVTLESENGMVRAEFRMGQSGPGRLTEWYCRIRPSGQE